MTATTSKHRRFYSSVFGGNEEPFSGYVVLAEEPGPAFYSFVLIYTLLALLLIGPLVSWSRNKEEKKIRERLQADASTQQQQQQQQQHSNLNDGDNNVLPAATGETDVSAEDKGGDHEENENNHNKDSASNSSNHKPKKRKPARSTTSGRSEDTNKVNKCDFVMEEQVPPKQASSSSVTSNGTMGRRSAALRSAILRELDQSYPDRDPDFQSAAARMRFPDERPTGDCLQPISKPTDQQQQEQQEQRQGTKGMGGDGSKAPTETSSGVPSAATTSRVYLQQQINDKINPSNKKISRRVLDVGGRRWKNRRPIGRVDVIQNAVASEISSIGGGNSTKKSGSAGHHKKKIGSTGGSSKKGAARLVPQQQQHQQHSLHSMRQRMMSDVASSILSEQHHELNQQPEVQVDNISLMKRHHHLQQLQLQQLQLYHQQQQQQNPFVMHRLAALQRQQQQQRYHGHRSSRGSRSVASERSVMSSIVDDISPNDAADAGDPGRGNIFIHPDVKYLQRAQQRRDSYPNTGFGVRAGCCSAPLEGLLMLAALDDDKRRVVFNSIPLTLGACSEALFRLVTTAFISQYLGTDSMVAFLLVGLFVRLTSEELAGAIIDALSSFIQASIYSVPPPAEENGMDPTDASSFLAGQYVQLAVILQLILNIPLLLVWVMCMEEVILWFVHSATIAAIAQDYAFAVVFAYLVQALSRTLTVVFHIYGHEHFESIIDLVAATLQLITIACVVALVDNASLTTVGYIQVLITVASAIAKITFPIMRGWMQPFRKGLIQNVALVQNKVGIWYLLKAAGPLLLGTILEYGEWELLTIFVRHLGTAEVATWALLGAFWDVLEALTEGIGEAAANQVAFLLSVGLAGRARNLSHGAIYIAVIQALLVTSILYMSGQYLCVLFSSDPTIQHLMNNSIGMIGFANVIMAFAQIAWSLVGAQGRFRLATCVIFVSRWLITMPCALVSIYAFLLDLNAVSGSLVVGYATATCALTFVVLRSDWDRLVRTMQEMNLPSKCEADENDDGDADMVDPVLGLVDLEDFDDSDDSDGIGFG